MKGNTEKGFTLVELIVVIVIIGILSSVAVPKFIDLSEAAKIAACKMNQTSIETAATIGYAKEAITAIAGYPVSIAAMVTDGLLDATPQCPGIGSYIYNSNFGTVTCSEITHKRPGRS